MNLILASLVPFLVSGLQPPALTAPQQQAARPLPHAQAAQTGPLVKVQASKPATAPTPAKLGRDAVIAKVEQALTRVKTAEGVFSQVDATGTGSGRFYISRPGKVRFDYTSPEPMHIVSDGVSVSIEEPKRDAYDAVPLSSTPLNLFLRTNVNLKRDGSIKDISSANGSWFVALEDASGEAEGQMILEFRESDFELLGWRSIDGAGDETRVRLTGVKTNTPLKPGLFIVRDPADRDGERR